MGMFYRYFYTSRKKGEALEMLPDWWRPVEVEIVEVGHLGSAVFLCSWWLVVPYILKTDGL